jgi:hypothetical protein
MGNVKRQSIKIMRCATRVEVAKVLGTEADVAARSEELEAARDEWRRIVRNG